MKRKAFISYSINDSEQYVLTQLSNLLRKEGFSINSSFDSFGNPDSILYLIKKQISESSLFIGLVTQKYESFNVLKEWQQAQKLNIPSLLLVEESIPLEQINVRNQNVVMFNRDNPEIALNNATVKIREARASTIATNSNNVIGWVLGGLAILLLIDLLSDD